MRIIFLLLIIIFMVRISKGQNIWESTGGPEAGEITYVLNVNDSLLFAGSQKSSIYKSSNFGEEWQMVYGGNNIYSNKGVAGMVVFSDQTIIASCFDQGILKSTDYGETWNYLTWKKGYLYLTQDEEKLFLIPQLSTSNIQYSTDQGNSWTIVDIPFLCWLSQFSQNQSQDIWLLCTDEGVLVSTDNGNEWE